MSESIIETHIIPKSFKSKVNDIKKTSKCAKDFQIQAQNFKYYSNSDSKDIINVRQMLLDEQGNLPLEQLEFWRSDLERIMFDDWLVSRFLLRGQKGRDRVPNDHDDCNSEYSETMKLIRSCAKFRYDYQINGNTMLSEFPYEWTQQNGLFSYKPDLAGNPTIYLRTMLHKPKLIETKESRHQFKRMLLYTLECCDRELVNKPGKAICCIFDMTDANFENVDLELVSWMIKSFKTCSPKLLCYVIIYNLPWFFSATFRLISNTLMSNSNKQSLKFVYGSELLNYIDKDNLPAHIKLF